MEMVEQKIITSLEDFGHLKIIDFNRCNGLWDDNFVRALNIVGNWMIGRSAYTIIRHDMRQYPQRSDFPHWEHVGKTHLPLARLYWNMFHACYQGSLTLHDMPDFSGTIILDDPHQEVTFWGDIGKVSASTFAMDVLPYMHDGDLWISVVSEDTHIVIEFLEDIGRLIHKRIGQLLFGRHRE